LIISGTGLKVYSFNLLSTATGLVDKKETLTLTILGVVNTTEVIAELLCMLGSGNLASFHEFLYVSQNSLSGTIPTFPPHSILKKFHADQNQLTGSLPQCFYNTVNKGLYVLNTLDLQKNFLNGTLSSNLCSVRYSNNLSGSMVLSIAFMLHHSILWVLHLTR